MKPATFDKLILNRDVETCLRVGVGQDHKWGQRTETLRKNPHFSAILVNFKQKLGGKCPPPLAPLFPTPLLKYFF